MIHMPLVKCPYCGEYVESDANLSEEYGDGDIYIIPYSCDACSITFRQKIKAIAKAIGEPFEIWTLYGDEETEK